MGREINGIRFVKTWGDIDLSKYQIETSNGSSVFINRVYVNPDILSELIEQLHSFSGQIHGGIYDMTLGSFGPEFAGGAIHNRLHFQPLGKIHITARCQSGYSQFSSKKIANESLLHLVTEPALLDNFLMELQGLEKGVRTEAFLECV
ncbi:MAG: hypothetical protein AAGC93_10605 [Cyanobacteria bacterium P01_F01_bin.53]